MDDSGRPAAATVARTRSTRAARDGTARAAARRGRVQLSLSALPARQSAFYQSLTWREAALVSDRDHFAYGCTGTEKTLLAQLVSAPKATSVSLLMYSTPM